MTPEQISAWPGKSIDGRTHPALWHMLDVGAVAACLTARRTLTGSRQADRAASLLVTLHDLGKFSVSFRAMLLGRPYSGFRHWQHSYRLLRDHDGLLSGRLGATPRRPENTLCRCRRASRRPAGAPGPQKVQGSGQPDRSRGLPDCGRSDRGSRATVSRRVPGRNDRNPKRGDCLGCCPV